MIKSCPLVTEIPYHGPEYALCIFSTVATWPGSLFFDSATIGAALGRYSYIALDPFAQLISKNGVNYLNKERIEGNLFDLLEAQLKLYPLENNSGIGTFQGGIAGFFSYDLYQQLEEISPHAKDDMEFPDAVFGFYDVVMGFDHVTKRAWIFSSGFPEQEKTLQIVRARKRTQWLQSHLEQVQTFTEDRFGVTDHSTIDLEANFTEKAYLDAVQRVTEYIRQGDIFEANLTQRFKTALPSTLTPFQLYQRLRHINPAPFAAYLNFNETIILSASPERFLSVTDGFIETRPIKGTRPRGKNPEEDNRLAEELRHSEKDNAENIMIVDLLRNDLSKVCEDHSVLTPQVCGLESFATVHHLVSIITGKLKKTISSLQALKEAFPGGSITGAPKVRAMEIIAELESTARGPYCGAIGYIGFNGDMDTAITIRSYAIKNNQITFQAGGAIVLDSDPKEEYAEMLTKAFSLKQALLHDFIDR